MESLPSIYYSTIALAVGFSYNGYGFFSLGANMPDATGNFMSDTWRFIPDVKEDRANDYSSSSDY